MEKGMLQITRAQLQKAKKMLYLIYATGSIMLLTTE